MTTYDPLAPGAIWYYQDSLLTPQPVYYQVTATGPRGTLTFRRISTQWTLRQHRVLAPTPRPDRFIGEPITKRAHLLGKARGRAVYRAYMDGKTPNYGALAPWRGIPTDQPLPRR